MKLRYSAFLILFSSCQLSSLLGQTTLVDWDQGWNYMHPTAGALPAGSGTTTPHPDGTTPWYAGATEFDATYSGPSFVASGVDFDAGLGTGPLGYGTINYFDDADPAPAEFASIATSLTRPPSGQRHAGYFRTTFTVPDDGNFHVNPVIRYVLDDGGFIYLDGELIMRVNVGSAVLDEYEARASGTANTESQIRTAEISLPPGSSTGGNDVVDPAIGSNATIVKQITRLEPGTHTLAVSMHNAGTASSDLMLALQVQAEVVDCVITASVSSTIRDTKGTVNDVADDTIGVDLTVASDGIVGAGWVVTGPLGSAAIGESGGYGSPVSLTGIPIAEFAGGPLELEVTDLANDECSSSVTVVPQRLIATDDVFGFNRPIATIGTIAIPGWTFDDVTRNLVMENPGGDGSRFVVTSEPVSLLGLPDVQFSGTLQVDDTSSGNEIEDEFVAYLIYDGDFGNPVNLITRHDLISPDGILSGDELASGPGIFSFTLNHVIPGKVDSVQIVVEAINNSDSEVFTVQEMKIASAPPELQAYAGPLVFDNQGTPNPADDMFFAPLTITGVNLGASTGWASNGTPAAGLYADSNPVDFGPFLPFTSPRTVTLSDVSDPSKTASVVLTLDLPAITVLGPTNVVRVENGPGYDDDTVTFDLEISGSNGGPGWESPFGGFSPTSGDFGVVTFTVPAPLTPGAMTFDLNDVSYGAALQSVTVNVPDRYIIGQSDLSGDLVDIENDLTTTPSTRWVNDPVERTLSMNGAGAGLRVVTSETIDLSAQGEIYFSARLQALDTSTGSNFETSDQFKAELVYTILGTPVSVNLVVPFDVGTGGASTTGTLGGANGPANGFLNGYSGAVGTDLENGTVYATNAEDYEAHRDRDEFNIGGDGVTAMLNSFFNLSAIIPEAADDVRLIITGGGVGNSESFIVSDVLFSSSNNLDDKDGDGMSDEYETANGLDPNSNADRDLDLDGDGRINIAESIAGTAANDATSLLQVTDYTLTDTTGNVTWSSVPGKIYRVEFSTDLETWTELSDDIAAADAPAIETASGNFLLSVIGNPEKVFFRVRVVN